VCLSHQFDESEEVIRLVKNIIATVTAIKNVVNKTALRCSGCARHSITTTTLATQLKYNVPFLRSRNDGAGRIRLRGESCGIVSLQSGERALEYVAVQEVFPSTALLEGHVEGASVNRYETTTLNWRNGNEDA